MAIPTLPTQGAPWLPWGAAVDAAARVAAVSVAATVTASGALVAGKHNPVDATAGAKAMTLPTGQAEGTQVSVEKADASTNVVSVTGSIRGVGSSTITLPWQNEALLLRADAAGSWWPVAGHKTKTSLDAAYVSTKHGDLLRFTPRWAPPPQSNPTVYTAGSSFLGITAAVTEDVIVYGRTGLAGTSNVQVTGGRHVRFVGGKYAKTNSGAQLRVTGVTGSVSFEGIEIDASGFNNDALVVSGATGAAPDVYIQKCRVYGVNGTSGTVHGDLFQPQGPIGRLFVDLFTGSSNYQGFFLAPQQAIGGAFISRTNLTKDPNGSNPVTYQLWFNDGTQSPYPVILEEVYVSLPAGQVLVDSGVWPKAGTVGTSGALNGLAIGAVADSDGTATWPTVMQIDGKVYSGAPTGGDFCPAGSVGIGYVPKSYQHAAPPLLPSVASVNGSYPDLAGNVSIATVTDATTAAKGIVQLAGDLGGTAAAPTVAKIGGVTPAVVATSGSYTDLTNKPTLATVATTGSYTDLSNKPTIPTGTVSSVNGNLPDGSGNVVLPGGAGATGANLTGHCYTVDPRVLKSAATAFPGASRTYFMRAQGNKTGATKFRIYVGVTSGNISLALYSNNGSSGPAAAPTGAPRVSTGAIACPAVGSAVITPGSSFNVAEGDWLAISCDNTTATFATGVNTADSTLYAGLVALQGSAHPTPATVGAAVAANLPVYIGVE